jgi:acid phosphatase type 7
MRNLISRRTLFGAAAALVAMAAAPHSTASEKPDSGLHFAVYGDCRDGHEVHRKLVAAMLAQKPVLVLQTGDLVHRGTDDAAWKIYDEITGDLRKKTLLYPARGNHDFGGTGYAERFTAPFTSGNKDYYSFTKGSCHFIALDIDEHAEYGPETEQYKWLIKDLEDAKKTSKHIFVYFHLAPYSIGSHGMNEDVQKVMGPVFKKYGVRIVFTGHDHNYYHTTRDGVPYIVTGGGGAPLYDCHPEKGAIDGDKYEKVNHYLVVDVKGNDVTVQAIRVDGTLIEKFTVSAK